jgi:flagellar hook-associated protein 1
MAGVSNVLNIGISGLNAAAEGMQTVSNNTANVNTPGYNLESINQVSLPTLGTIGGGSGSGTDVTSVQRAFDQYIFDEIVGANATSQSAQTILSNSQNLAALFPVVSGGVNGLSDAISTFFGGANTVAQNRWRRCSIRWALP